MGVELSSIALRYENRAAGEKCGYVSGSVLTEGEAETPEELVQCYRQCGYKLTTLPKVPLAVSTTLPCRTSLSHYLKDLRVHPHLRRYIEMLVNAGLSNVGPAGVQTWASYDLASGRSRMCFIDAQEILKTVGCALQDITGGTMTWQDPCRESPRTPFCFPFTGPLLKPTT